MLKLSEEQRAILGCYSGTKEEVIEQLIIAVPFIEDIELREMAENLLLQIGKMGKDKYSEEIAECTMEAYEE